MEEEWRGGEEVEVVVSATTTLPRSALRHTGLTHCTVSPTGREPGLDEEGRVRVDTGGWDGSFTRVLQAPLRASPDPAIHFRLSSNPRILTFSAFVSRCSLYALGSLFT